jgi:hypothetical protein
MVIRLRWATVVAHLTDNTSPSAGLSLRRGFFLLQSATKKKNATNTYTSDTEATISLSAEDNVTNVYVFFFSKCKTNEYFIKRHVNVKAKNDTQG